MKGWRTVLANVIMILLAVFGSEGFTNFLPADSAIIFIGTVIPLLNIVLRFFTDTKIGSRF